MSIENAIAFYTNDSQNQKSIFGDLRHFPGTHFFHRIMIGGRVSLELPLSTKQASYFEN